MAQHHQFLFAFRVKFARKVGGEVQLHGSGYKDERFADHAPLIIDYDYSL